MMLQDPTLAVSKIGIVLNKRVGTCGTARRARLLATGRIGSVGMITGENLGNGNTAEHRPGPISGGGSVSTVAASRRERPIYSIGLLI